MTKVRSKGEDLMTASKTEKEENQVSMSKEQYLSQIVDMMKRAITECTNVVNKFQVAFKENPAHALTWSDDVFEAAAVLEVFGGVTKAIEGKSSKVTPASLYQHVLDNMSNKARNPSRSSSSATNYMESMRCVAWAMLYEMTQVLAPDAK